MGGRSRTGLRRPGAGARTAGIGLLSLPAVLQAAEHAAAAHTLDAWMHAESALRPCDIIEQDGVLSAAALAVRDVEVDVMIVRRAFERSKISNPLYVAHNGIEALAMLRDGTLFEA